MNVSVWHKLFIYIHLLSSLSVKVKLSLYLTKYHVMKTYHVVN